MAKSRRAKRASATRRTRRKPAARTRQVKPRIVVYKLRWRLIEMIRLRGSARTCGLTVEHQTQTQWCWAAVSNSVSHFYDAGSTWTQCTIVNAELGQSTCCSNGSSSACNKPWYLDKALTRVGCLLSWAGVTFRSRRPSR